MNSYTEKDLADLNKVIQANFVPFGKAKSLFTAPAYPTDDQNGEIASEIPKELDDQNGKEMERMEQIRMRKEEHQDKNSKQAIMATWRSFIKGEPELELNKEETEEMEKMVTEIRDIGLRDRQIQAQLDAEGLPELSDAMKNMEARGREEEEESSDESVEVETFKFRPVQNASKADLLKCDYLVLKVGYTDRLIQYFNQIQRDLNSLANKTVELLGVSDHFNGADYNITTYKPNVSDKEVLTPLLNVAPTRSIYFRGEAISFYTVFKIQKIIQDLEHCGGFDCPQKINLWAVADGKQALVMEYDTESG